MYFQPEIEAIPHDQLEALQLERMGETLKNSYENVEFYKNSFDAAGVTPDDFTVNVLKVEGEGVEAKLIECDFATVESKEVYAA